MRKDVLANVDTRSGIRHGFCLSVKVFWATLYWELIEPRCLSCRATKKRDRPASLVKTPRLMTIVLPDHLDRMPQLKKPQTRLAIQSKGFVPPHELVSQQDILASSLPVDPTGLGVSVRSTFRPVSFQHSLPCLVLSAMASR